MIWRRRHSLLPWTAGANIIALLILFWGARITPPPADNSQPDTPLVQPTTPTAPKLPDKVVIKKENLVPVPGPNLSKPPTVPSPWPNSSVAVPHGERAVSRWSLWRRDEVEKALDAALAAGGGPVPAKNGSIQLVLPASGNAPSLGDAPTVVALADGQDAPRDAARLSADDPSLRRPHDVRGWWRGVGEPGIWLTRSADGRPIVYVGPAVRAGWLAGRREAVSLLRNLLADPRLVG